MNGKCVSFKMAMNLRCEEGMNFSPLLLDTRPSDIYKYKVSTYILADVGLRLSMAK
jgi:hypothetical protein